MANKLGTTTNNGETIVLTFEDGAVCTLENPPFDIQKRAVSPFFNKNPQESMAVDVNANKIYVRDDNYKNLQVIDYTTYSLLSNIILPYTGGGRPYIDFSSNLMYCGCVKNGDNANGEVRVTVINLASYSTVLTFDILPPILGQMTTTMRGIVSILSVGNGQMVLGIWTDFRGTATVVIDLSDYSVLSYHYTYENAVDRNIQFGPGISIPYNQFVLRGNKSGNNIRIWLWYYLQATVTSNIITATDNTSTEELAYFEVSPANNLILIMAAGYMYQYNLSTFALISKTAKPSYTGLKGIVFIRDTRSILTCDTANHILYQLTI